MNPVHTAAVELESFNLLWQAEQLDIVLVRAELQPLLALLEESGRLDRFEHVVASLSLGGG